MENLIRILITVMLVGLVVMVIVFFSVFGIVPVEKLSSALKGEKATSTNEGKTVIISTTTVVEKIIEKEVDKPEEKEEKEPEPVPFEDKYKHAVILENGEFAPSTINVEKGDVVKIGLKSKDEEYTVRIPDYGLFQTVTPEENKLIAFQALSVGEYPVICEGCKEGFQGRLIIRE